LPALVLGVNPDARIIMAAHTAALAEANSRDVQRILESPAYQELFPQVRLPKRGFRQEGRYKRTDEHFELVGRSGYLRATGVGGAITGFGFDFGNVDDPIKSAEEAQSAVYREKIWEWFTRDFWTRRSAGARVVIVMTRWHREDLIGRILALEGRGLGQWEYIRLPALAEEGITQDIVPPSPPEDRRRPGEALWPELITAEELRQIQEADPRGFAALYQQQPTEAGGVEWPPEYFGPWLWVPQEEWPRREDFSVLVIAIDPSRGREDAASDYAAIVWAGLHRQSELVYIDADLAVRPPTATLDRTLDLWDQFRPDLVAVEVNQFQLLFAQELERRVKAGFSVRLPIVHISNYLPKLLRLRRLGPWLAAKELRFAQTPGAKLIVDQMRQFPQGAHDDGPDALEMALRVITEHAPRRIETLQYRPGQRSSIPFDWSG
jgi:predicted phage terminase large subunit-like protein